MGVRAKSVRDVRLRVLGRQVVAAELLAEHLRKSLHQEELIIVGHPRGSVLGLFMAKARPELFYALVRTGQVADSTRNYGSLTRAC